MSIIRHEKTLQDHEKRIVDLDSKLKSAKELVDKLQKRIDEHCAPKKRGPKPK